MKPETRLMTAIFGETSTNPSDDDFYESANGESLREVLLRLIDEIAVTRLYNAPAFSQRVRPLLLARFGFNGPYLTYKELGEMFDVTRERVRQGELKALRMLRHPSRSRQLKPFIKQTVE